MSRLPANPHRHDSHAGDLARAVEQLAEIVHEIRAEQGAQGERMAAMARDQERTAEILERLADRVIDHGNRLTRAETIGERESRDNASRERRVRFLENRWAKAGAIFAFVVLVLGNLSSIVSLLSGGGS